MKIDFRKDTLESPGKHSLIHTGRHFCDGGLKLGCPFADIEFLFCKMRNDSFRGVGWAREVRIFSKEVGTLKIQSPIRNSLALHIRSHLNLLSNLTQV